MPGQSGFRNVPTSGLPGANEKKPLMSKNVTYGSTDGETEGVELTVLQDSLPEALASSETEEERSKLLHLFRGRLLSFYQVLLVVFFMSSLSYLFYSIPWLAPLQLDDVTVGPSHSSSLIRQLSEAFVLDKRGLTQFPDIVYLGGSSSKDALWFGTEPGFWMWAHGPMYALVPPALLHAVSGGIMDPLTFQTTNRSPPICFERHTNKTQCLVELISGQVDLKSANPNPKDGYFVFVGKGVMHLWKLRVTAESESTSKLELIPTPISAVSSRLYKLFVLIIGIALTLGTVISVVSTSYTQKSRQNYVRKYIAQGMFLYSERESNLYDQIASEEVHHDEHCHTRFIYESDSDPEDEHSGTMGESTLKAAKEAHRKLNERMMAEIGKDQGTLNLVSAKVTSTHEGGIRSSLLGVGPSLTELLIKRTASTVAHALILFMMHLPVTFLYISWYTGNIRYGYGGIDSGLFPVGAVRLAIRFLFVTSYYSMQILLFSLILHYLVLQGHAEPVLKPFADHDHTLISCYHSYATAVQRGVKALSNHEVVRWAFVRWAAFSWLSAGLFWLGMCVSSLFVVTGLTGLLLHFFTNMFTVTAIVGSGYAAVTNFKRIEEVVNLVHSEIAHAGLLMDILKDGLTKSIVELAVIQKRAAQSGCTGSVNFAQAFASGFVDLDVNGTGHVSREVLENRFGPISDVDWHSFDHDGDGTITLSEWQHAKIARVQKGVLLVRSAFESCVQKQLAKHGFTKATIARYTCFAVVAVVVVLSTIYLAMKTANAIGAMSSMISSGLSALAIGFLNAPRKKELKHPRVDDGIKSLNKALQKTVADAVAELFQLLRFYPVLIQILEESIETAAKKLAKKHQGTSKQLREHAEAMIAVARKSLTQQKEAEVAAQQHKLNVSESLSSQT